jgi:hypothetical protein
VALFTNFTRRTVGETIGLDGTGAEFYTVVVRATFTWDAGGVREAEPTPLIEADRFDGEPGVSSPVEEADFAPYKPRVDVILAGDITLSSPTRAVDATLEIGSRIRKAVRVFGDRYWIPGVFSDLAMTEPRPFLRMPITWSRSFGGRDREQPQLWEPRNPVGVGMSKTAAALERCLAPNFETPDRPIRSWKDRPTPVAFGPVGRSWQPRIRLAGTYDAAWQEHHFPMPPKDFDERFHNCAPEDQQLPSYSAGETVRLTGMSPDGRTSFTLPPFAIPILISERRRPDTSSVIRPDTIVIEPAAKRFTLVGRHRHTPTPNALAITDVLVGEPWRGWMRARRSRKRYLGRDPRESS